MRDILASYRQDELYQEIIGELHRRADETPGEYRWYLQHRQEDDDPIYLIRARNVYEYWLKLEQIYTEEPSSIDSIIFEESLQEDDNQLSIFEILRRRKVNRLLDTATELNQVTSEKIPYHELPGRDFKFKHLPSARQVVDWLLTLLEGVQIEAISAGDSHALMIDSSNNVWGFRSNWLGQLGLGEIRRLDQPMTLDLQEKAVSAGRSHSLVIDLDDNVLVFGSNQYGELGLGDRVSRKTPQKIPGLKAKAVSAGGSFSLVIDLNNNVWSFGYNGRGELGLGNTRNQKTPQQIPGLKAKAISAGWNHSLAIDLEDNVWSFGYNVIGQLGLGDTKNRKSAHQIPGLRAKDISAGFQHSLIVDLQNNVWGFGTDRDGQLGGFSDESGYSEDPIQIGNLKAEAVSVGRLHSLAISRLVYPQTPTS